MPRVLHPSTSHEWVRVIDGIDFGTAAPVRKLPPKKRPAGRTVAGVAYRLAWWADSDGSNLRPSVGRIAVICRVDFKTAQLVMAILRDIGLIELVSRGGGSRASEYRLTVPEDLLEQVCRLSPRDIEERVSAVSPRRHGTRHTGVMHGSMQPRIQGGCTPVCEDIQGGCTPVCDDVDDLYTGVMPPCMAAIQGCIPPPTDQLTTPTKTSPQVSTSPETPPETGEMIANGSPARPDVAARAAALRANYRSRHPEPAPTRKAI